MVMTPNITRAGRIARGTTGTLCILGGVGCLYYAWPAPVGWRYALAAGLCLGGLFQWYEARKRWCVMRACGFKTPM
jgi:hypothetical protein